MTRTVDIFIRLRAVAADDWTRYTEHEFVRQLGAGTLPEAAFRTYLIQDYLFLIQFSRAWALAAYKSRRLADLRAAQETLGGILREMELHVKLCGRWGIPPERIEAATEDRATIAYTRFVLDAGAAGDLLDLHVALAPCVIGYAEIGRQLAADGLPDDHPYREWISEYAGEDYQAVAAAARDTLDELAGRSMTEQRFIDLAGSFATASRLEADFWQMGLDAATSNTPAAIRPAPSS